MMTFVQYLEAMQAIMPSPLWLTQATASSLATPNREDTRRAIERAAKRGRAVTPDDLRASISPESQEAAKEGIKRLSIAQTIRTSDSTPGPTGSASGPSWI